MIKKDEFKALMASCIVPELLKQYIKISNHDDLEAIHILYNSELYSMLSNEKTKLWHLSPLQLAVLLKEEEETGVLEIPDGAALWAKMLLNF